MCSDRRLLTINVACLTGFVLALGICRAGLEFTISTRSGDGDPDLADRAPLFIDGLAFDICRGTFSKKAVATMTPCMLQTVAPGVYEPGFCRSSDSAQPGSQHW